MRRERCQSLRRVDNRGVSVDGGGRGAEGGQEGCGRSD